MIRKIYLVLGILFLTVLPSILSCNKQEANPDPEDQQHEDPSAYNINNKMINHTNWREQEFIYIYDNKGTDVVDDLGRQGYTKVPLPWRQGDVQTNLPEGFCDKIVPENGWEWVLNRCGSRDIVNNNFFALYNKYIGTLRFFFYMPTGEFSAGNDHVWQLSMNDHLAERSIWKYPMAESQHIQNKATLGQTGSGSFMCYITPWTNYMSDDGLITPNGGWWAFDVDFSQTRSDDLLPNDNIRLQMRSWDMEHTSLNSTMKASIEGSFAGDLNAEINLIQSQHLNNTAIGALAKLGTMAGGIGSAIYNFTQANTGDALSGLVEFAKGGCNLAGIKTEMMHDIDGSLNGKMEGTITLSMDGVIDTEGTIKGSRPTVGVASPTIYMKDFDLENSHLGQGVWNLKTPPVVYAIRTYDWISFRVVPYFYNPSSLDIQLNPDIFAYDQIEWITVESICTAKTADAAKDNLRSAYGLNSYFIDASTIPYNQVIGDFTFENILQGGDGYLTAHSDFLYAAKDKMGFDIQLISFHDDNINGYYRGRHKDGLLLEPIMPIKAHQRLPFLEVNVLLLVKLKDLNDPLIFSRTYLPIIKPYKEDEFKKSQSLLDPRIYKHTALYDYQMQRIKDLMIAIRNN